MNFVKRPYSSGRLAATAITCLLLLSSAASAASNRGETEFKEHCAACHAGGGNIIKPDKPLSRTALGKHGIKSSKDIVAVIRKPGPGMTAFDKKSISDKEAKAIGDYILKTFK